jgi:4-amino-4-deoxy-L-arabinose transferase-like glycosyltransferase
LSQPSPRLETSPEIFPQEIPSRRGFSLSRRLSSPSWPRLGLLAILALASFLDLFRLEELGYNNEYYASAVKSMLANWPNFFFGAFDPAGFITVDKPPVFLWVQAGFAWMLGFSGLSLLLPQAIAGVVSVWLLYRLVGKTFGEIAGLLAALALALTPIFVVTSRHNNPESLLTLVLLLQVYALTRAIERGRLGWLMALAGLAGLGFNLKMLEALVTLPAFFLVYLLMGRGRPVKRVLDLTIAGIVVLVVSFSWALLVDAVPPGHRPFIGGSTDNTVTNLILSYNGFNRVETGDGPANFSTVSLAGQPGPLRLFLNYIAGESNWLVPLALFGLVVLFATFKSGAGGWKTPRNTALLAWAGWLASFWLVFSFARGTIHPYYLVMLALPLAALTGAGLVALWQAYREKGWQSWRNWFLPGGLLANTLYQVYILAYYPAWNAWLMALVGLSGLVGVAGLVRGKAQDRPAGRYLGLGLIAGQLLAPLAWSLNQLYVTPLNPTLPSARPGVENEAGLLGNRYIWENVTQPAWAGLLTVGLPLVALLGLGLLATWKFATKRENVASRWKIGSVCIMLLVAFLIGGFVANDRISAKTGASETALTQPVYRYDTRLLDYLTANRQGRAYLAAVPTTSEAGPLIIQTGLPVLAYGGFMGIDPALSPAQAAQFVRENKLRFFLVSSNNWFDNVSEEAGTHAIYGWASRNCRVVDPVFWKTSSNGPENPWQEQLYDCGSLPS